MRKLKALLVLLFAACLSLTLFACGGGDDDNPDEQPTSDINRITATKSIELTDAQEEADFQTALANYTLTVRNGLNENTTIHGSDCEVVSSNIVYHVVDDYSVTLKPKDNNGGNMTTTVKVTVDHAWGAADANGKEVCSYDKATRISKDEDVAIHYGTFHTGTANTELATLAKAALSEEEAANLGLHAENTPTAVFNDAAGVNAGKTSSGRIKPFGLDHSAGKNVLTLTAGNLEPGMSITIEGYAKSDIVSAWGLAEQFWNAPSYGIADPYATTSTYANKGNYVGGNSVIVRSEGWVLYDGIGDEPNRLLAGLPAFVEGARATYSGKNDGSNYGSHPDDNGEKWPEGFNPNSRPGFTDAAWKDWWVYSEGTGLKSGDSYSSYTPVKVTWTYRTYKSGSENIGIIIIDSTYNNSSSLRSYIKVPETARGYYETIIHGDYSSLLITKTSVVETETFTGMRVNGTKQNAVTTYLAGEAFDAGDVVDVEITSEQNTAWHTFTIGNDMLYYYVPGTDGENTLAAAQADDALETPAGSWVSLEGQELTTDMKVFKVMFERSDKLFTAYLPENAIKVVQNNVAEAFSDDYDANLLNRDPNAAYTRTLGGEGSGIYVNLALERALFRGIPQEAVATFSGMTNADDYRYAVLRLVGIEDAFNVSTANGSDTDHNYYWAVKKATGAPSPMLGGSATNDVLLAIAVKAGVIENGTPIVITGLQDTPIHIVYGKSSIGFTLKSTVTGNKPILDKGGSVTLTYTGAEIDQLNVYAGSTTGNVFKSELDDPEHNPLPFAIGRTGVSVTAYNYESSTMTMTVTLSMPQFGFASWTEMPRVEAVVSRTVQAVDYIEYKFDIEGNAGGQYTQPIEDEIYFYAAEGKLYFVATQENDGFLLTMNNGDRTAAKSFDLSYEAAGEPTGYEDLRLVFSDPTISTDAFSIRLRWFTKASGPYAALVTVVVDIAEATGFTGDFGFEVNSAANPTHYWWYTAATNTIAAKTVDTSGLERELLVEGDCYTMGVAAYVVKDSSDSVVYLAGYTEIGGNHEDSDHDSTCDLCGEQINQFALTGDEAEINSWKWSNDSLYMKNVKLGDVYDFEGTFVENPDYLYGNVGIVAAFRADTHLYWMRTDGWMKRSVHDVWTEEQLPTSPEDQYMTENEGKTNADLWTDLPYNTLNGVVDLKGNSIDTMVETNFESWIANKTLRIIARVMKNEAGQNIVDVEWRFYDVDASLVLNYHQGFKVDDLSTLSIGINYDTNMNVTKAQYVKASTNKSVIESIENTAVTIGQPGTQYDALDLEFTENGFDDAGNVVVKVDGVAGTKGTQRYVTAKVNFASALAETTRLSVLTADGEPFTGAVATLDGARTSMTVYVPVTPDTGKFIVKIVNYEAYTLQSDVLFDLTDLAVSDANAALTGDTTALAGGTFNVILTGVNGDDTLVIGDATKKLSEITTSDADLGNGLKVKAQAVIGSGSTVTLVFTRAAADLGAKIPAYEIKIMRGTQLLALEKLDPAITIGEYGVQIDASGWYARAEGTKLYVFGTSDGTELKLNVNAGDVTFDTDPALLGVSDFTFTVENGAVKFDSTSILSAVTTAVYTASGASGLTAFAIDLTSLGVTASTVYGFEIEGGTNAYSVAANRNITSCTQGDSAKTVRASSCTVDGINAVAYKDNATTETVTEATFYGAIEIVKGAHTFPAEGGNCSVCGQVAGWRVDDVQVGKTDNSQGWLGGSLEHGAQKAYNPTGRNSSIVKGQKITASGVVTSSVANSYNGIAILFYPGNDFNVYGTMHIRGDAWINGLGNRTGGVDETSNLRYAITAKVNGGNYADATYMAIAKKANATIVWDWTDESKVVITYTLAGIDTEGSYVMTVTITPEYEVFKEARYSIGITPDGGSFVGSIECICEKDFGANVNLEKAAEAHVHSYNAKDRCTADNSLKPDHNHTYVQGVCSVCEDVCKHTNVSGTECQDCHATLVTADSTISTATPDNYWGNDAAVSTTTIEAGKTYVYTAQYEASQGTNVWRGAILKTTVGSSLYSLRYIDGWHPDAETEVHSLNLKGGNYNYDTNAKDALDGTYMKVVVELANGTLTITLTQYASTDSAMATPQATRIMTISGIADEAVGFAIANGDGTHFVNNQVKLSIISYTWAN